MKKKNTHKSSRRKFIIRSAGIIGALATIKLFLIPEKKKPVKMLTRDGKLVEVDMSKIPGNKKKISDSELRSWIKNSKTSYQ